MKGYKAFNQDMTCRKFQYEIGKTYETDQKIGLCESGFHFCKQPAQVFEYYGEDARVCEVEASGEIIEGNDKCACSKITILHELVGFERGRLNYGYGNGDGYGYGYGNGYGDGYGYGNGNGYGDGNGNGNGKGNGNGNGDGYGEGYGDGYGDGDGYGEGYGDGNGYGYGYGYGRNINKVLIFKEV